MMANIQAIKRKKKRQQVRRRVWPTWIKPAIIAASAFFGTGVLSATGWWAHQHGWIGLVVTNAKAIYANGNRFMGFVVDDVLVEGRKETSKDTLISALRIRRGDLIFSVDVGAARARLENIGWIAAARVERHLPDTIRVSIRERVPIAAWQKEGKFLLVDGSGAVIGSEGFDRFKDLKIVIGDDAPQHAKSLIAMLERQPALMARVKVAVRSGKRRWNLRMDNGVNVQLPEQDPFTAWDRLAVYERKHQLLDRDIGRIDLRFPGRVVVEVLSNDTAVSENTGSRT
jgi:cell division protein FtsQ|tara:strand:+ start:1231 stop:2085 length:855 start_codon:yes stop_codon:yes gene_type:complete